MPPSTAFITLAVSATGSGATRLKDILGTRSTTRTHECPACSTRSGRYASVSASSLQLSDRFGGDDTLRNSTKKTQSCCSTVYFCTVPSCSRIGISASSSMHRSKSQSHVLQLEMGVHQTLERRRTAAMSKGNSYTCKPVIPGVRLPSSSTMKTCHRRRLSHRR